MSPPKLGPEETRNGIGSRVLPFSEGFRTDGGPVTYSDDTVGQKDIPSLTLRCLSYRSEEVTGRSESCLDGTDDSGRTNFVGHTFITYVVSKVWVPFPIEDPLGYLGFQSTGRHDRTYPSDVHDVRRRGPGLSGPHTEDGIVSGPFVSGVHKP